MRGVYQRYLFLEDIKQVYGISVRPKRELWPMRLLSRLIPGFASAWTTYRLPFGKPIIAYPNTVRDPALYHDVFAHELIHVRQQATWWGLLLTYLGASLLPLPTLFSGRWFIERRAWLADIVSGSVGVEGAVGDLWRFYGWPWPRFLMRRWFNRELRRRFLAK